MHGPSEPMLRCQAAPGASKSSAHSVNSRLPVLPGGDRKVAQDQKARTFSLTLRFVYLLAANPSDRTPFFDKQPLSGARPAWKTIIHVLLALSSTLDLLRFKFPPLHRVHRNFFNLSFLAAALSTRLAPTAPLPARPLDTPL